MCLVFIRKLETVKENCPGLLTETEEKKAGDRGHAVDTSKYVRLIIYDKVIKLI